MGGYLKIAEGKSFDENLNETTATDCYIDKVGGADDLPELGDPYSVSRPNLTVNHIGWEFDHHFEDGVCGNKYTVDYSTLSGASGESALPPVSRTDSDNLIVSGGSEVQSVAVKDGWYWHKDQFEPAGAIVDGRLFFNTVRGSISKTILKTPAEYVAYKSAHIIPKIGKINKVALTTAKWYYPYKKGNVLFSSTDERMVYDEDGDKVFEITLNFAYRILFLKGVAFTAGLEAEYSWDFLISKEVEYGVNENLWQIPSTDESEFFDVETSCVYEVADFTGMW